MDIYLRKRIDNRIDDLEYDLDELKDELNMLDEDSYFDVDDAEKLIREYKSELEREGLWNNKLEEHLNLFLKFDLNKILNRII